MAQWIFRSDSALDKALRLGVGGSILGILAGDLIHLVRPSAGTTAAICILLALVLFIPVLLRTGATRNRIVQLTVTMLSVAYVFMGLLYFFNWIGAWIPSGRQEAFYDATTDAIGTLFFVTAWFLVSKLESAPETRVAEHVSLAILCILVVIAGSTKLVIELQGRDTTADYSSARLMLNLCNGAIFLSLYNQMRRNIGSPDVASHVLILFYGCAQIAAHGRDCLAGSTPCSTQTTEGLVALAIAWSLLLGKIAFAAYLSYLFFTQDDSRNRRIPASSEATA
jgi:hypothetical protein